MDLKSVEKIAQKIQANLFKKSNSHAIGILKSHFKGSGLQFKEHQVYSHGDDVRFIDWKMLAKTNTPYIKTFIEERNVDISVVLDISPTMFTGYKGVSKLQVGIEIICLLYLLAKETNDFVNLMIIDDQIKKFPTKNGHEGIVHLISYLEEKKILTSEGIVNVLYDFKESVKDKEKSNLILTHLNRKKEVIILSDFQTFLSKSELVRLSKRMNLHLFRLVGPLDEKKTLPFALPFKDKKKNKVGMGNIGSKGRSEILEFLPRRCVKRIDIGPKYLEQFIQELVG